MLETIRGHTVYIFFKSVVPYFPNITIFGFLDADIDMAVEQAHFGLFFNM